MKDPITVNTVVKAPMAKVWDCWNKPEHIKGWAFASDDWEAPTAENDLKVGGKFKTRMQSKKDANEGFDFGGTYTDVRTHELIEYDMDGDRRHVKTVFEQTPEGVKITQTFDPEGKNPPEMQRSGWQSILNNFKKYTETEKPVASA
jgi:uncharacterized protein YndB with AHSA1/START domain